jgi:hypothetical protein
MRALGIILSDYLLMSGQYPISHTVFLIVRLGRIFFVLINPQCTAILASVIVPSGSKF